MRPVGTRRRTTRRELRALLRAAGQRPVPVLLVGSDGVVRPESRAPATMVIGVAPPRPRASCARGELPTRRELRALLRATGRRSVPPVAPAFVAAGDARLRVPAPALVLDARPRRERRAKRPAVLSGAAAAAAALVLTGALTGVVTGPGSDADLVLGVAIDTIVMFPDGSEVDGSAGLALPDGALVRTGPRGRAAAGGVELGPGLEAVVDAGELLPSDAPQASPANPVTPGPGEATAAAATVADDAVDSGAPAAGPAAVAAFEIPAPLDLGREPPRAASNPAQRVPAELPGG